jgi:hypothetical protein
MYLKVIACEIALREICWAAARTPNTLDLQFLPQGLHDNPSTGRAEIQAHLDAVPAGKYDAILLGYALCGNIVAGLRSAHTPLVIPRAHDCITFFLGSRARYEQVKAACPSAYFYTSGWLECVRRRGDSASGATSQFLPSRAGVAAPNPVYQQWVAKYGEEKARYLMEVMDQWTTHYTHGVFIDFDFTEPLGLRERVQGICAQRGWQFATESGDITLLQRWLDGDWDDPTFLVVQPNHVVAPSYDEKVIAAEKDHRGS